jgi:hypothetical protein
MMKVLSRNYDDELDMLRLRFQNPNIGMETSLVLDKEENDSGIFAFYDYVKNRLYRIDIMDYKKRDPKELCEFLQKNYEVEL